MKQEIMNSRQYILESTDIKVMLDNLQKFKVPLYLVGDAENPSEDNWSWDFVGIFTDREKATNACKDCDYFIYQMFLNDIEIDRREVEWPMICFQPRKEFLN